ncbi:hypothetical protein AVEN_64180-1 [Araneus ventricosus]|uniref:Uncharacterized protein n=1 Tax=Araneus ventricosus TaxID=182803 RepID=A0A4Y2PD23_ARAVE|nr:hypothetical protein AVEN_64180-1 [Araneus ventricosus]
MTAASEVLNNIQIFESPKKKKSANKTYTDLDDFDESVVRQTIQEFYDKAKVKEGVFVNSDIQKLMKDEKFEACMTKVEKEAWSSFKEVVNKFMGNYKDPNFKQIVQKNLGVISEEHGARFHQDIKQMECRHQGRWNKSMIADYCWSLHREQPQVTHRRSASTRSIQHKRKRYYKALET